jgi:hypothetical protein
MAERMVRTTKENTQKIHHYQNVSESIEDFRKFKDYHNFKRKLKVLRNRTPDDKMYDKMIDMRRKRNYSFIILL